MRATTKFVVVCLCATVGFYLAITHLSPVTFPSPAYVIQQDIRRSRDAADTYYVKRGRSEEGRYAEQTPAPTPAARHNQTMAKNKEDKPPEAGTEDLNEPVFPQRLESPETSASATPLPSSSNQWSLLSNILQLNTESEAPETNSQAGSNPGRPVSFMSNKEKIKAGEIPVWWQESWARSAVYKHREQFVGEKPLFPSCKAAKAVTKIEMYPFIEPPNEYLPPEVSKNPCWYQTPRSQKGLHCVPYVYLAGVAKCGTSDIYKRLRMHPEFFSGTQKEYHWWERNRFGMYDQDNPEKTVNVHSGQSFHDYLMKITGTELADLQRELRDNGSSVRIFGDFSPSYMWDPHNWYVLEGNQGCDEPRMVVGQHIRHVWPPAKILMTFRHPTPRLYSRFISRIHRTPELRKATTKDFHDYVVQSTQLYTKCFQKKSIRQCAYDVDLFRQAMVRLVEGMYPVFMQDWLRIWPPEQLFIMRYEDYQGHERQRISELIQFLGLRTLDKKSMDRMMVMDIVNSGQDDYQKYGQMLPETKEILDRFYQPFVDQFATILNDQRFLWKDVYQ